jgi:DNA polymerase-3 subunit gamma/tau
MAAEPGKAPDLENQAFYRKWRSQTFGDLAGQEPAARTLRNAVKTGRIAHAYLFCGPRGVGKTSAARILAKAVNCPNVRDGEPCGVCDTCRSIQDGRAIDVIELDAASNRGIEQIRDIRDKVGLAPASLRFKLYILDEAHMLTTEAANALLKTLEEPPPHAVFVLVTTDAQRLPETIVSRCQRLDFRRIALADAIGRLTFVCQQEGIEPGAGVLELLARKAGGSLRDAEGQLDQVVAYSGRQPTLAEARAVLGVAGPTAARELVSHLVTGEVEAAIRAVNDLVDGGSDPRLIGQDVVDVLRGVLLLRTSEGLADLVETTPDELPTLRRLAQSVSSSQIVELIRIFSPGPVGRASVRPQLPLEMAVVEGADALRRGPTAANAAPTFAPPAAAPARDLRGSPANSGPAAPTAPSSSSSREPGNATPAHPASEPAGRAPAAPPNSSPIAPPPAVTAAPSRGGILPDDAQRRWGDILEALGTKNRSVQALLRSARPLGADADGLVLGFAYEFHRGRIEDPKNRAVVEDIIERVLGARVRIRCVLASKESVASADPLQAVANDPLVRAAVQLGARVRSVTEEGQEEKR